MTKDTTKQTITIESYMMLDEDGMSASIYFGDTHNPIESSMQFVDAFRETVDAFSVPAVGAEYMLSHHAEEARTFLSAVQSNFDKAMELANSMVEEREKRGKETLKEREEAHKKEMEDIVESM